MKFTPSLNIPVRTINNVLVWGIFLIQPFLSAFAVAQSALGVSVELSELDGSNGFVVTGVKSGDLSGSSVSGSGDINGDGWDDLVISASKADLDNTTDADEIYVLFGSGSAGNDGAFSFSDLNGSNGFTINGVEVNNAAGLSVSHAGDVNADGIDDLFISVRNTGSKGNAEMGTGYVVFGSGDIGSGNFINLSDLDGSNGFTINGNNAGDNRDWSMSGALDFNGDGIEDLLFSLVSASPNDNLVASENYVVFGGLNIGNSGTVDLGTLDTGEGVSISGINPDINSGWSLSSAGDINADGIDDLIIGALFADIDSKNSGSENYVVYGSAVAGNLDLSAMDGINGFVIEGIASGDNSGYSVAGAGDVNADGVDDLIISSIDKEPDNTTAAGEAYVLFGGASVGETGRVGLAGITEDKGVVIRGVDEYDNMLLGWMVSSVGDINGDGIADLLIGAPGTKSNGKLRASNSFLLFGNSALGDGGRINVASLPSVDGFNFLGADAEDQSGYSVSGIGDFNADGFDDFIIGARFADPNGNVDAGESYVVFGNDWAFCNGRIVSVNLNLGQLPTTGDDVILGTDRADVIQGGDGDDIICGMGGDDFIHGDSGNDWIDGGDGIDDLRGGNGDDVIHTGLGATVNSLARVKGEAGNDELFGGTDADDLHGGAGDDIINGGGGNDLLRGGAGNDVLNSGEGNNNLKGGIGEFDICRQIGNDNRMDASCETVANANNVLFLLVDDMNWWTSAMIGFAPGVNASVFTPNIDRIANRGTYFTNAHVSSGSCKPSRAGIWSGLRNTSTGIYGNSDPLFRELHPDYVTLDRYFKANGYQTVSYGKTYHGAYQFYEQFDEQINTFNLELPEGVYPLSGVASRNETAYDWGDIENFRQRGLTPEETAADLAIAKLNEPSDGRSLFLTVGMKNPHLPLHFTTAEADRFFANGDMQSPLDLDPVPRPLSDDDDISPLARDSAEWGSGSYMRIDDADAHQAALGGYLAALAYADSQIGRILDVLDDPSNHYRWDNTTVVFTSDHGRHLGDKNNYHKNTLWDPSTRVPLIIWSPDHSAGPSVVDEPVSTIDIYPTLVDSENLAHRLNLDGVSLVSALDDDPNTVYRRRAVVTAKKVTNRQLLLAPDADNHYSIQAGRYRYIRWGDGSVELYDSAVDPYNFNNLAHRQTTSDRTSFVDILNLEFIERLIIDTLISKFDELLDGQRQPNQPPSGEPVTIENEETDFLVKASDPNGDYLTFTVLALPESGILSVSNALGEPLVLGQTLLADNNGTVHLHYHPNLESTGISTDEVSLFQLSDGRDKSQVLSVVIQP